MAVSLDSFNKALLSLEKALAAPKTDLARDAAIQRFEFCFELAWKTSKRRMGTASSAPRVIIREMAAQGLIADPKLWFDFIEARNLASHSYNEAIAEKVYDVASVFLKDAKLLAEKLRSL